MLHLQPKINFPLTYNNMKRNSVFFLLLIVYPIFVYPSEKLVISKWLSSGTIQVNYPVFHDHENVKGKQFSDRDLLVFEHLSLNDLFPEQGLPFSWPGNEKQVWTPINSDSNGYVFPGNHESHTRPQIAYLATYITINRWLSAQLEIKSPYLLEAWLNGTKIGTKGSVETEENTIGKVTQELKLTQGTHLLVIKTLRPPDEGLEWKVVANLEVKDPFKTDNIQFGINPVNIKTINHLLDGVKITDISPSPDGKFYSVSYSKSLPPSDQSESWTEVKNTQDGRIIHTYRHSRASRFSWLPKSNAISFTTTRDGKSSLHWHHMESGEQRTIMEDIENLGGFRWTPDESMVVYSIREEGTGTDASMRHIINMNDRQPNWRHRNFLYKLDVSSGIRTRLTYGNATTSLQDVSPDSKFLLISQTRPDYKERPYSIQNLYLLNIHTLDIDTIVANQRWSISATFSPDGTKLLATGGPNAFDGAGITTPEHIIPNNYDTQAYLYDIQNRSVTCFTHDFNPSVSSVYWHPTTNHIFLLTVDQDFQQIYRYDIRRNQFSMIDTGIDFVTGMKISDHGHLLTFWGNQANDHRKAFSFNLRNNRISLLEDTESHTYRHVEFGEVNDWDFTASSGVHIKGRYYLPPDFDPGNTYPVIVYYYGGTTPVGRSFGGRYPFNIWAGNGYVVYVLQPSGAIGFGQSFSAAHVNNWGITVADEIIEGTQKFLEAHPFTDPAKVGCAGASYGGFMTMLLTTRTDIFAAAISHAGISSISSYWGEGFWGYSYSALATAESFPWNNQDIYVGQSPLFHADKVTTPLLLITGDSDTNVPPGESIQMYTALKLLDRPVELVLVKGEDHHILTYSKRILWHNAIMGWWDKYLKDQPEWWKDQFPENNY
jgi:dipeptidyl aminopeptidase/acylaminoacyl peptidase